MGNRIACSDLFATSTEVMTEGEDIVTTPCSKKILRLSCRPLLQAEEGIATQQGSFLFLPILSHISPGLPPLRSEWLWLWLHGPFQGCKQGRQELALVRWDESLYLHKGGS